VASYDAQINLIVGGLRELDRLSDRLRSIEKQIVDVNRLGVGPRGRDPETGQFTSNRENRERLRRLQEISQREDRIASARRRLIKEQNDQLSSQILLQSRLNSATDLYQRKLEEFSRGGAGSKLTDELKNQVQEIKRAFDEVTNGGTKNLSLVRSLATELGRVVERQNEINRLSTFQSKAYFQAQQFERQIATLRSSGVRASAFSGVGGQMREFRSASSRGSEFEAQDAARKIKETLARIAREFEESVARIKSADKAAASWEKFLSEAAVTTLKIKQDQKDAASKWQAFFNGAAAETLEIRQYAKDTAKSWQNFFQDAGLEADRLRTQKLSKFAFLRGTPNAYETEAGPLPAGRAGGPRYFQEIADQQKQLLGIEKEISQIREESIRKTLQLEEQQFKNAQKRKKLYGEISSSLLDAVSFGKGSDIERVIAQKTEETIKGLKNSLIRGGLGLGGLGLGKAAFATSGVAAALAQQAATQAAGFKGLGMLDPTAAMSASAQAIIQTFGSIGNAVNDALGGVPGVVADMLSAVGQIPDSLGLAAVAAFAFAPAIKNVSEGLYNLGKAAGETKIGASVNQFLTNINPLAAAAYGSIEALTNGLDQLRGKAINLQQIAAESKNLTRQLNDEYESLPRALPAAGGTSFKGAVEYDPRIGAFAGGGARALNTEIAQTLFNGEKLSQVYGSAGSKIEFMANGAGVLVARSEEAAASTSMFAEKLGQAAEEAKTITDYLREAVELQKTTETSTQRFIRETRERGRAILENQKSEQIARERSSSLLGGQYSVSQVPVRGELFPGGRTETRQPDYRAMLNQAAQASQAAEESLNALRQRAIESLNLPKSVISSMTEQQKIAAASEQIERRTLGNVSEGVAARRTALGVMQQEQITLASINAENERSVEIIRQRNRELRATPVAAMTPQERVGQGIFDPATLRADRLRRVRQGRKRQEAGGRALSEGLVGGAFPLLFGQGVGASLGGLAGGIGGGFAGGGLGFGLSLIGTALGSALDGVSKAAQDTGKALRYPAESFEQLKQAGLLAGKQQEFYIKKLIESGRIAEANAVIQSQIISKIGTKGVNDLAALGKSSDELSKAWAEFNLQLQAALAGPLAGLLKWVANILALGNEVGREVAFQEDVLRGLSEKDRKELKRRESEILNRPGGNAFNEEARRKEVSGVYREFAPRSTRPAVAGALTPEQQEASFKAAQQVADEIRSAYREGFQLQQQAIDLQRQGVDLQRRVADDIFNKQQEIQRKIIDTENQKKQIAIETVDLEYRRRISNEEGRVAEVLAAEAEFIKVKKQGEADIEAKKRNLELDIAKQKRDTENYIFQLSRDIDNIRRATLNYEMQVADYRLEIERKIEDQRRITNAAQAAAAGAPGTGQVSPDGRSYYGPGGAASSGGFPGGARTSRTRDRDAERTGWDITMPGGRGASVKSPIALTITGTGFQGRGAGSTGKGYGNWITGEFSLGGKNYELLLGHFDRVDVAKGMQVPAGTSLGTQGITGRTFGTHVTTHVNPRRGASTSDAWAALDTLTKAWETGRPITPLSPGSIVPQYQSAQSQVRNRPVVPMASAGDTGATMRGLTAQDEKIRRRSVQLEEQLNKLGEKNALQRLSEIARGEIGLKQRNDAIALLKNEITVVRAGSQELQERVQLEADILTRIELRAEEDRKILATTKLTGEAKQQLEQSLAAGLAIQKQQVDLDREALNLTQQKRFEIQMAAVKSEGIFRNIGVRSGYIGEAAAAFEAEMRASGDLEKAKQIANETQKNQTAYGNQMLEAYNQAATALQQVATWENIGVTAANSIGDAFGNAFRQISAGTASTQEILAGFFQGLANSFADMAAQMIANMVQMFIYKQLLGGLFGGAGAAGAAGAGVTGVVGNFNLGAAQYTFANGGVFTNGSLIPFAMGGIVSSPTLFKFADGGAMQTGLMGEAGPEAILPLSRGPGGRLGVDASVSGGGGITNNVTVNVDASGSKVQGDDQQAGQLGRIVSAAVQQELIKQQRPGGILAR
jgi:murein DD-endopeptidase MepM/ murein hydrolase activator NlpD